MNRYLNATESPPLRQYRKNTIAPSLPMVNPLLLEKVTNVGLLSQEISLQAIGLGGDDLGRLEKAGILTLAQLAGCDEATILVIPHFGTVKVRRMKANLNSYFTSALDEYKQEIEHQRRLSNIARVKAVKPNKKAVNPASDLNPDPELEGFSESLDKLEKRMRSLELRSARVRKNDQKNTKQAAA